MTSLRVHKRLKIDSIKLTLRVRNENCFSDNNKFWENGKNSIQTLQFSFGKQKQKPIKRRHMWQGKSLKCVPVLPFFFAPPLQRPEKGQSKQFQVPFKQKKTACKKLNWNHLNIHFIQLLPWIVKTATKVKGKNNARRLSNVWAVKKEEKPVVKWNKWRFSSHIKRNTPSHHHTFWMRKKANQSFVIVNYRRVELCGVAPFFSPQLPP